MSKAFDLSQSSMGEPAPIGETTPNTVKATTVTATEKFVGDGSELTGLDHKPSLAFLITRGLI